MQTRNNKKTLVLGASTNPARYSYRAMQMLQEHDVEVVALGLRKGEVGSVEIQTEPMAFDHIHTVTIYMSAERQKDLEPYILSLKPQRIIFNPGAENEELAREAQKLGIETLEACTLVMLRLGLY